MNIVREGGKKIPIAIVIPLQFAVKFLSMITEVSVQKRNKPEEVDDDSHISYSYFTDNVKAIKHFDNNGGDNGRGDEVETFDIQLNKTSIIQFLNNHCSYPDNG